MKTGIMFLAVALGSFTACNQYDAIDSAEQQITEPGPPLPIGEYAERVVPLVWMPSPDWTVDGPVGGIRRTRDCGMSEPDISTLIIEIDEGSLPHGKQLVGGAVHIDPCDGPRTPYLPDNRLVMSFDIIGFDGIPYISSGGVQDQSLTVGQYVEPHDVELRTTDMPQIDRTHQRMLFRIENEFGLDALGGMRVLGVKIFYKP